MRLGTMAAAGALALALCGCTKAPGYPKAEYVPPDQVTDFTTLYNTNCRACHGANGQNGPAIDLRNPEYEALIDDATLRKTIANGMPGTQMPAWAQSAGGMLTDAQVDALVAGMRKEWGQPAAFQGATPPPYAAAASEKGDAQNGQKLYQAQCASCHQGPARQQVTSPVYLALMSDQALRSIIVAGRPDIGQPDWRHDSGTALTPQNVTDIVAYLGSLRNPDAVSAAPPQNPSRR